MRKLGDSYKETKEMFSNGAIPLDCFTEISRVFKALTTPENLADNETEESMVTESYDNYLGGAFYLVESYEDLDLIDTCEMREDIKSKRGWKTLAEVSSIFDIAEKIEGDQNFVQICMIWNNAGGNLYFIPPEYQTENVINSISETSTAWSDNASNPS